MYHGSEPRLSVGEGSGALRVTQLRILPPNRGELRSAACLMAPDPASLPGGLQCRHCMPCGVLWAVSLKHKEKSSMPDCAARLACSQRTWRLFPRHLTSGSSWTCKTCGLAAQLMSVRCVDMRLQYSYNVAPTLLTTHKAPL
jgi:hypothetical protein